MTSDEIKRLRELANAATPGPWTHEQTLTPSGEVHCDIVRTPGAATLAFDGYGGDADFYEHDAAFIAAARTALPALLDRCEAAEAEVERWQRETAGAKASRDYSREQYGTARAEIEDLRATLLGVQPLIGRVVNAIADWIDECADKWPGANPNEAATLKLFARGVRNNEWRKETP